MAIAGRVAIVPKGDWSADATYKRLDAVTHNNTLYFAKKEVPAGTATSNTEYWSRSIVGGVGAIATTDDAGIVKPDGTTITVDADGTIHGKSEIKVDGTTITLDEAKGIISLAKTLQEKIGTIDDKLPAANVANNQITTVEGFALDARQANPNLDGTLAKQISDLNGSLNKIFSSDTLCIDAFSLQYSKGYYVTGPQTKNLPDNLTYGFLFILDASGDLWRLLIYIPTSQANIYTNFYNGYGDNPEYWNTWHKAELSSL